MYADCVGRIGIPPSEYWDMDVWEVQAAAHGYRKRLEDTSQILEQIEFAAARWNAGATAFDKKQSKAIARFRFPWEKARKQKQMSFDQIGLILSQISKPAKPDKECQDA